MENCEQNINNKTNMAPSSHVLFVIIMNEVDNGIKNMQFLGYDQQKHGYSVLCQHRLAMFKRALKI